MSPVRALQTLQQRWEAAWPQALAAWSRFTKLSSPRWCLNRKEASDHGLSNSFAMIRLTDHAVVIDLQQVVEMGLQDHATAVLAHEIGHHVYAPADLVDNARLLARVRRNLPTRQTQAHLVANLYTDLLINDRLQRSAEFNMAAIYQQINRQITAAPDIIWQLYMRIYEILWGLSAGTLTAPSDDSAMETDAQLGARVIRVYSRDWLRGASRFAALLLPYLLKQKETAVAQKLLWLDTEQAGEGAELPDGLTEIEDGEDETVHPSEDPDITGISQSEDANDSRPPATRPGLGRGRETVGGQKNNYRDPEQYRELVEALGVKVDPAELVIRYYRERALPYRIRFPQRELPESVDPLPEGVETWEPGSSLADLDWTETAIRSPVIVPGVTTVQRTWGVSPGTDPDKQPLDLYVGIDCSGSMSNPARMLSYPVLAGTIVTLAALRAGASVMACLSGEPGEYSQTDGFERTERSILKILTGYLGTGYAFGIERLRATFLKGKPPRRATHLLVVSDSDIFHMLGEVKDGWEVIKKAVAVAGGGGTFVLQIPPTSHKINVERMRSSGWNVHMVTSQEALVELARAFSKLTYEEKHTGKARA